VKIRLLTHLLPHKLLVVLLERVACVALHLLLSREWPTWVDLKPLKLAQSHIITKPELPAGSEKKPKSLRN
jgi:hypothetical protein